MGKLAGVQILLAEHRKRRQLTQEELFKLTGVSVPTINRIEHGSDTYVGTLMELAKGLRVKPGELLRQQTHKEIGHGQA